MAVHRGSGKREEEPCMHQRKMILGITSLLVGLIVAAGGMLTGSRQAKAEGQCHKINTTQAVMADFATFTTDGEIKSGFLKGTTKFTGDPSSLSTITGTNSPPVEPLTFSYTGDLEITTHDGTLATRSVGVFEGIPFGVGTQFDRVTGGTGLFNGANGFLFFIFEADSTGGVFVSSVSGEVCVN
jgi:hypothetical protein